MPELPAPEVPAAEVTARESQNVSLDSYDSNMLSSVEAVPVFEEQETIEDGYSVHKFDDQEGFELVHEQDSSKNCIVNVV